MKYNIPTEDIGKVFSDFKQHKRMAKRGFYLQITLFDDGHLKSDFVYGDNNWVRYHDANIGINTNDLLYFCMNYAGTLSEITEDVFTKALYDYLGSNLMP